MDFEVFDLPVYLPKEELQARSPFPVSRSLFMRRGRVSIDESRYRQAPEADFESFSRWLYRETAMNYPKFYKMDPLAKLALLGAHQILPEPSEPSTALLLANSRSSCESDRRHQASIADRLDYLPSPSVFAYTLPNIALGEICIKQGFKGPNLFFLLPRPDWDFMLDYAADLLETSPAKTCLIGWVDVALPEYEAAFYYVEKPSTP